MVDAAALDNSDYDNLSWQFMCDFKHKWKL